jgi:hypothetical protein
LQNHHVINARQHRAHKEVCKGHHNSEQGWQPHEELLSRSLEKGGR